MERRLFKRCRRSAYHDNTLSKRQPQICQKLGPSFVRVSPGTADRARFPARLVPGSGAGAKDDPSFVGETTKGSLTGAEEGPGIATDVL